MVLNRYQLSESTHLLGKKAVLVCNPTQLDELFKLASVSKKVQRLLLSHSLSPYILSLQAKNTVYAHENLLINDRIFVKLPKSSEEVVYMGELHAPEVWETGNGDRDLIAEVVGDKISLSGGTAEEQEEFLLIWKAAGQEIPLYRRFLAVLVETFEGFSYKKRRSGSTYPFPLFRAPYVSVFWQDKKALMERIFEQVRRRYEAKRSIEKVPARLVSTPNLDHLRMLLEEKNPEFISAYEHAFLQIPDGYQPLVMYAKASLGYQTAETISGVEVFTAILNKIGQEALPYTVYLVGGWGNAPYKIRDYFDSIYPGIVQQFVGCSTPPKGFLNNPELYEAIKVDIDKKKPDFLFVCASAPNQELFIERLRRQGVNFGLGFGLGRTFDLFVGFQKKEPWIVTKLHLGWIHRAFTGRAYFDRVANDLRFAVKTVFSK